MREVAHLASSCFRCSLYRKTQSRRSLEDRGLRALQLIGDGFQGVRLRQRDQFAILPHRPDVRNFLTHEMRPAASQYGTPPNKYAPMIDGAATARRRGHVSFESPLLIDSSALGRPPVCVPSV
jgi:hypothetical protein